MIEERVTNWQKEQEVFMPEAFQDLFTPSRYKVFYGGRGGGKSHQAAQALILKGYDGVLRWLCTREIQKSLAASVHQLMKDKIYKSKLDGFYRVTKDGIFGANGTKFLFAGLRQNAENIKSMEGLDGVWIEEANYVSRTSWDLLTPTLRKPGSEVWCTFNPTHEEDPVYDLFLNPNEEPPPRSIIRKVNWRDNPFFTIENREEMEYDKKRDRDKWLHVWEGNLLSRSDTKVFRNKRVDDLDSQIPRGTIPRYGADWGFSIHPTCLVECYIWGRTLYIRREAWALKCDIDHTPALFAGSDWHYPARWENPKLFKGMAGMRKGYPIISDSARPETISFMKRKGFKVRRAIKGAKSVEEGVEFMNSYDLVIHPECKHVITEIWNYSYKVDPLTNKPLGELLDKHNHTIDACRYALESVRRNKKKTTHDERWRSRIIGGESYSGNTGGIITGDNSYGNAYSGYYH